MMKKLVVSLFAAAAVLAPVATAAADTTIDEAYVTVLRERGITGPASELVRIGGVICSLKGDGYADSVIAAELAKRNEVSLSQGAWWVEVATAAYCPSGTRSKI